MVRTIYQQLSPAEVHGQLDRVVEQLREPFAQVAELLADAAPDILAFTAFPVAHWQKLWSNNPQERLNREIRRRRACPRKGTWWAFSPTGYRRGAWWARCWPSNTTNGPKPAATSPSPTPPATRHCRAQHAGRSGLINIKRDDALLHLLTGHYHPILGNSALDRLANASYQIVIEGASYRERLSPHRALLGTKGGD